MTSPVPFIRRRLRFEAFEMDLWTGELRRNGRLVELQEQPFQVLAMLLERPGELVTREALRERLWPQDTFVDFDGSLATAIRKVRKALGDSARNPRFVETLPNRGYRFLRKARETPDIPPDLQDFPTPAISMPAWRRPAPPPEPPAPRPEPPALPPREPAAASPARRPFSRLLVAGLAWFALLAPAVHWPTGPGAGMEASRLVSVAVLPFRNLSGDPAQDVFTEGVTAELVTSLARNPALRVPCLAASKRCWERGGSVAEVGRELRVEALVQGSVARAGGRVWIHVQLLDPAAGRYLWAERFESAGADALDLQAQVCGAITERILARLQAEPKADPRFPG
jgi:TolB-like protein/DNA-binding winged helix-turn-helix (wHTH) protein